jgi:hypothetical protein
VLHLPDVGHEAIDLRPSVLLSALDSVLG